MNKVPRVPVSCPPGFAGRYIVTGGDTMFDIAQFFRIPLSSLITANPHIANPARIFPGDVLCSPGLVPYPCCLVLGRQMDVPTGTVAAVLVYLSSLGTVSVSVVAALPLPSTFGEFDVYVVEVLIPEINGFGNQLLPTAEDPPTYAVTISLPTAAQLTPETRVVLRPANSDTGLSGPVILSAALAECGRTPITPPQHISRQKRKAKSRKK